MADQRVQLLLKDQDQAASRKSGSLLSGEESYVAAKGGWFRARRFAHRFWVLEASASLLSLMIFAAVIGILNSYNNTIFGDASKTQSSLSDRPTIFPLLAIMSTVMRASMLLPVATAIGQLKWSWFRSSRRLIDIERFDEASHGLLGSVKLMFFLRLRNIATIGAALTILALPLDAVIQSAVLMPSKQDTVTHLKTLSPSFDNYTEIALLGRARTYTIWSRSESKDDGYPSPAMVNALLYGQGYSNGLSGFVEGSAKSDCPTGYCHYNTSQTLGIGYKCVQRTDILYVPADGTKPAYQTLADTNLKFYHEGHKNAIKQYIAAESYKTWPDNEYSTRIFGFRTGPLIARTAMLFNPDKGSDKNINKGTYGAECGLFWVVSTRGFYINGTTNFAYRAYDVPPVPFKFRLGNDGNLNLDPERCIVNGQDVAPSDKDYFRNNCNFMVGSDAHRTIQDFLTADTDYGFMGNLTLLESYANKTTRWNKRNLFIMNLDQASANRNSSDALSSINQMWKNIAFATTFHIGNTPSTLVNNTVTRLYAPGSVSALVFYYKVDWWRLAGPGAILLCCSLFVLYTALSTRKQYAWRMSALPYLFHGLEDRERFVQRDLTDYNEMEDIAKMMRVRLAGREDANGAKLVAQN